MAPAGVVDDDPFVGLRGFCDGVEPPKASEFAERRAALQATLSAGGYAGLVLEAGTDLEYLTGLRWGRSERPLLWWLPAQGDARWVGPAFEAGTLEERCASVGIGGSDFKLTPWEEDVSPYAVMAELAGTSSVGRVALGPDMRSFILEGLRAEWRGKKGAREVEAATELVSDARMVKSPAELRRLRRANEATKAALASVSRLIVPGMTEADARPLIRAAQEAAGLQNIWVLALFGPNAAFPHGTSEPHTLADGDLVLVDTGGSLHGYQSDITRTWGVGRVGDEARKAWDAVLAAQTAALAAIRPGAKAGEADALARAELARRGYDPGYGSMTHRLGHGIGLEGHEAPYLRKDNARALTRGMTMSNEPGIYVRGRFGVRIEDIVAVTDAEPEVFGSRPSSLESPFE